MRLLLVDGSNMVMRCAYGGDLQPEVAVPSATGQIARACESLQATHMVVCLDFPEVPSWRKQEYPEYKAHRKYSTAPWLEEAERQWRQRGWHVAACPRFEADDLIATLAYRANRPTVACSELHVLSSDSDLLPLLAARCRVHRPGKLGELTEWTAAMVAERYGVAPEVLPHLKALMGESGDNLPGAAGIGEKGAMAALAAYQTLENVLLQGAAPLAAKGANPSHKIAVKAKSSEESVRLTLRLATLRTDAPLPPLRPSECAL